MRLNVRAALDWLLSVELAVMAPIIHVQERLANRRRDYPVLGDRAAFRRRQISMRGERLKTSARRLYREFYAIAVSYDFTLEQLRRCRRALRRFWVKQVISQARSQAADVLPPRAAAALAPGRSSRYRARF